MTGTELKIITPAATEVLGPDVDRLPRCTPTPGPTASC